MKSIFEVIELLKNKDQELWEAREALMTKEDNLWLYADWDALKKEKSITNQRQREGYVRECTKELKKQVQQLTIEKDNLKRTYYALMAIQRSEEGPEPLREGFPEGV